MRNCKFLLFGLCACAASVMQGAPEKSITLPLAKVASIADRRVKTYPARVVPVAKVDIVPQVSGEILEVAFENGSPVKPGDLLYRLDSVKYEAAVKNAEAKVAESRASYGYAELSYSRHKRLVQTRAVSQDAVDNALSARDSAKAALAAAQADLTVAKDNLKHCRIVAPISAKIGTTAYTMGNYVTPSSGSLVTLIQYRPIRVRFSMSNRDFLEMFGGSTRRIVSEGSVRLMLADGTEYTEEGQIEYSENSANELTDTIQIYALYPNEKLGLRPGSTVTMELTSKNGVFRPAISPTAILQDVQGPYVWVVGADGVAERRYIARGHIDGDWQFIEKGLKAGETIVADGGHKVKKGMIVKPAPEASADARGAGK